MSQPLTVDIWSDVICPWCYIGKRKFETALAELGDAVPVEVRFHAYQLDPSTPPGADGLMLDVLARKFGSADNVRRGWARLEAIGAEVGIDYQFDKTRQANTLLAHRLLWLAAQPGSPVPQAVVKERLMRAYFTEGRNVGDADTLAGLAAEVGFDRGYVRGWLDTDAGRAEVAADIEQAGEYGITAVPTFVINHQWSVPGAQDTATFVNVLRRLHEKVATGA